MTGLLHGLQGRENTAIKQKDPCHLRTLQLSISSLSGSKLCLSFSPRIIIILAFNSLDYFFLALNFLTNELYSVYFLFGFHSTTYWQEKNPYHSAWQ